MQADTSSKLSINQTKEIKGYYCTTECKEFAKYQLPFSPVGPTINLWRSWLWEQSENRYWSLDQRDTIWSQYNHVKQVISMVDVNLANGSCSMPPHSLYSGIHGNIGYQKVWAVNISYLLMLIMLNFVHGKINLNHRDIPIKIYFSSIITIGIFDKILSDYTD